MGFLLRSSHHSAAARKQQCALNFLGASYVVDRAQLYFEQRSDRLNGAQLPTTLGDGGIAQDCHSRYTLARSP
jgi:hypothetical protein